MTTTKARQLLRIQIGWAAAFASLAIGACSGDDTSPTDAGADSDSSRSGCSVDFTAAPTTFALISTVSASDGATGGIQGQGLFAANQISRGCGIDGTERIGTPAEVVGRDAQDNPSIAGDFVRQASRDGRIFAVGAGGPEPTIAAAAIAADRGFPLGIFGESSDELRGCTEAEIIDAGIRKIASPTASPGECWMAGGLVFRTMIANRDWANAAVRFATDRNASLQDVAFLTRDNGSGRAYASAGTLSFEASGVGRTATSTTFPGSATNTELRQSLEIALQSNPEVLFTEMSSQELEQLFDVYRTLGEDTAFVKPSNFDQFLFVNRSSALARFTQSNQASIQLVRNRFFGLTPTWDSASTAFQRWSDAYRAFDPDAVINNHEQPRTYDAIMILALAAVAANNDGVAIVERIRQVANPPGQVVYPDDFATARALLLAGEDIDYDGASGPVDIDESGEVRTGPFLVWSITAGGENFTIGLFLP